MRLFSGEETRNLMDWDLAAKAVFDGHKGKPPYLDDVLINDGPLSVLGCFTILPGYGAGAKVVSIYPQNSKGPDPKPVESSAFLLIDEKTKRINGVFDGLKITRWKVAADSAIGSRLLSRPDSKTLLVIEGGAIITALVGANLNERPSINRLILWNRTLIKAERIAKTIAREDLVVEVATSLEEALPLADIISSATASTTALIFGSMLQPGCHADLVGSFRQDMREADDTVLQRASIYVDCLQTAIESNGDIRQPLKDGLISRSDILGDLFDLVSGAVHPERKDITVYKNAGGAHFDLLISLAVFSRSLAP